MYCRQIFWSLILSGELAEMFELILHQNVEGIDSSNGDNELESMKAFCVFIKLIGNECFITNN
jgi:hypothetical protein